MWYNNYRIGDKFIYFGFSVMSAIQKNKLNNYWDRSGVMDTIREHLTAERVEQLIDITNEYPSKGQEIAIKDRLTVEDMRTYDNDDAFYSLLIQTGYMTYEPITPEIDFFTLPQIVKLSNQESKYVWKEFILKSIFCGRIQKLGAVLRNLKDIGRLSRELTNTLNNRLSYYDFEESEPEKTYHVFLAGVLTSFDYKWTSNKESGYGRYDIAVELTDYNLIFEFKKANSEDDSRFHNSFFLKFHLMTNHPALFFITSNPILINRCKSILNQSFHVVLFVNLLQCFLAQSFQHITFPIFHLL